MKSSIEKSEQTRKVVENEVNRSLSLRVLRFGVFIINRLYFTISFNIYSNKSFPFVLLSPHELHCVLNSLKNLSQLFSKRAIFRTEL